MSKFPPIEWTDLYAIGLSNPSSFFTDNNAMVIDPVPPKLVSQLIAELMTKPAPENKTDYLRHIRDILISLTDWTQTNDSPLNEVQKTAWKNYRQQLRDLPNTYSGDGPIPWPSLPG